MKTTTILFAPLAMLFAATFCGCPANGIDDSNLLIGTGSANADMSSDSDAAAPASTDMEDVSLKTFETVSGRLLVQFRQDVMPEEARGVIKAVDAQEVDVIPQLRVHVLELPPTADQHAAENALKHRPEVSFVEPDCLVPPAAVTVNDPCYAFEWHLPQIDAPGAWAYTTGSSNIVIAILDSGITASQPDLAPKLVPGWNTYDNNADTSEVFSHGTAVAGSAAACTNNGIGVAAPAWNCLIMPIRITDQSGWAWSSTIAAGLAWAADHGARVANVSYGPDYSSTTSSAAQYFMKKGGVVTMSAGNEGSFYSTPGNPYLMTIGASTSIDTIASFSNTGNNIDLVAPGTSIYTTTPAGGYSVAAGTSFSAPIVAGVAALVISANPGLTGEQVQDILMQSADDFGAPGWDTDYGWGRVNAACAVSMALGVDSGDTVPPTVSLDSPVEGSTVWDSINVQASASDNESAVSVTFYVDGVVVAAETAAPYAFVWDTLSVSNGPHVISALATDAAANEALDEVAVTVNNVPDTAPPTIAIVSPEDGAKVSGTVPVIVNASDNKGVVTVQLYVDNKLTSTSTTAPFTIMWNSRKVKRGTHTLFCKAYDAAGNVGTSPTVTVQK